MDPGWQAVVIGAIAALPGVLVGLASLVQQMKTHASVNSKMDKLLLTTHDAAYAKGQKDQQAGKQDNGEL